MGGEDSDKITRSSGDTLTIKITEDEETYRAKYLPDPKKLTDEKLVCTVCSVSLAREIHQGKTVQVHRALKVLVCEACSTFYGDGCFSADEDGDDKYCRWCGQGGTLFLCSTCNCAFCQKCVKQNLKASVLADLEKDDWKCYFCNPRPLFGCRTICWGALELNKIGMEKEKEKIKKQRERLEKMEVRKREKEEHLQKLKKLDMSSEDEQSTKKRKSRVRNSDSSSSEVMPAKKTRSSEGRGHVNGSIDRSRRKRRDSSSDEDDSDNKKITSKLRSRNKRTKKPADSSSEDEPDVRSKSKGKLKKKPSKDSSDSSDEDKKSKRKPEKKRNDSSDDESSDEKHVKKKRMTRRKKNDSETSSDHKPKKKNLRRKKKDSSAEDKSNDDRSKKQTKAKKKTQAEDSSDNSEDNSKRDRKKLSESKKRNDDSDDDSKKSRKHVNDKCVVDGKAEEMKLKGNDASVDNALVRKRIKLAVLWLSSAVKDISELGTLISIRATKFGKKKINLENLKTYDDVLNAVSKLKQLMSGIHSNYEHLEKGLEAQLKPWKILTGLEEPDKEKNIIEETNTTVKNEEVVKEVKTSVIFEQSTVEEVNLKSEKTKENNATDDMVLQWSGLSADEDSSEEKKATKALISKAKDTLDKEDMINGETETTKNDFSKEKVIDQSKNQDNTADGVSMTPSKNSTNIDDTENSESLLNQSENGLKDDSQTLVETSEKEDEKEAQDRSNISKQTDASHSGSDTDMFDASEIISSTQVNNGEDDDCSGDESKKEKREDSPESASKRKSELKGQ